MTAELQATRYDFNMMEPRLASEWEANGCFGPTLDGRKPFAIMMPPPNVTGTLHLGHALDNTLPDILVRRARMRGMDAIYQPGTDHASIAVHVVLERQWAKEGKSRFDYGRETFLEKAWEWKDHSAGVITGQLRRLGISCDWQNERFTMDMAYVAAVNKAFVELYNKGLIYRGQRLVNWDPKMQTAVSDLEVKHKQVNGNLWHVRYKFAGTFRFDGQDGIEIATTRPETILADGAIAIHPEDRRAKALVGQKVLVPVVNREIEIVADEMVDPEFGSGMVKITAAHDFNDFAFYQRHKDTVNIPLINLLTADGRMNENCPEAYRGMDRFKARAKIVEDLDALGQLMKVEPHVHNVGHAERDDTTVLEPYLTYQWYIKGEPLAKMCLEAADKGDITFVNARDEKVYRHWLENIQDWCISRQLWWGHRIPVWYKREGGQEEIYVGEHAPRGEGWEQDNDILDTWFSSGLWPFATQGWPQESQRLNTFYPGAVVMSGRDILFFWLVRMMMMGLALTGKVPFKKIYTHGLILDEKGQKMSKSKGNVTDPIELINEFGADAVRLTMASICSSEDMKFSRQKVEQSRNFCTKLWNASRFLAMQDVLHTGEMEQEGFCPSALLVLPGHAARGALGTSKVSEEGMLGGTQPVNRWIIAELKAMMTKVDEHLDAYEFNLAAAAVYHFTWGTWCDWYLELTKPMLAGEMGEQAREETKRVAGWAFEKLLAVLHPFIPFITEQVWQQHTLTEGAYLMSYRWPDYKQWVVDERAQRKVARLVNVVGALRQARTAQKLSPKVHVPVEVRGLDETALQALQEDAALLKALAGVESLTARELAPKVGEAVAVAEGAEFMMILGDLVDVAAERARLEKELVKMEQEMLKIDALLGNAQMVARAPAEVIAANTARRVELVENSGRVRGMLG